MPVIVALVGTSNTGKTTLLEKLVAELTKRGRRVATIKHAFHATAFDSPGKDSARHIQSGSQATIVASPEQMQLIRPVPPDISLEELAAYFGEDYDIILAEGFKRSGTPKLEVHRLAAGPPLSDIEGIVAVATDEPLETDKPQFGLDDAAGIADFLEKEFLSDADDRISLYINNQPVRLKEFPRGVIIGGLLGMISALNGVKKVSGLKVFFRKRD